jgi:hypothetical protein
VAGDLLDPRRRRHPLRRHRSPQRPRHRPHGAGDPRAPDRWPHPRRGGVTPTGNVIVPSEDGSVYAFDARGTLLWKTRTTSAIDSSPAFGRDHMSSTPSPRTARWSGPSPPRARSTRRPRSAPRARSSSGRATGRCTASGRGARCTAAEGLSWDSRDSVRDTPDVVQPCEIAGAPLGPSAADVAACPFRRLSPAGVDSHDDADAPSPCSQRPTRSR